MAISEIIPGSQLIDSKVDKIFLHLYICLSYILRV